MIAAYAHGFDFTALIFRFVSILGERYTHGHVYDFYRALKRDPTRLRILGDGRQTKSYLYVGDCIEAMLVAARHEHLPGDVGVYNLGTDEVIEVDDSVRLICQHMGLDPEIEHAGGARGWPGDSPMIHLDCGQICALGWAPQFSIREAILSTLRWFDSNPYAWEDTIQMGSS
jgi:UDP-glucose 4-epimerase